MNEDVVIKGGYVDIGPGKMATRRPARLPPAMREPLSANPVWAKLKAFFSGHAPSNEVEKQEEPKQESFF